MASLFMVKEGSGTDMSYAVDAIGRLTGIRAEFNFLNDLGHSAAYAEVPYSPESYGRIRELVIRQHIDFDVIYQEHPVLLSKPGMLLMDMDMTTVQIEGIDEIARALGVYDVVAELTHKAMQGHMDFKQSLTMRVAVLKDGDAGVIERVKGIMHETTGLSDLYGLLKHHGFKIGIASGGFTQLICEIDKKYGLDFIKANTLDISGGRFTGRVVGEIVDGDAKAAGFDEMLQKFGIDPAQTICIGDGANDLKMLKKASLCVGYHGKPAVVKEADFCIGHSDMRALCLYLRCANGEYNN